MSRWKRRTDEELAEKRRTVAALTCLRILVAAGVIEGDKRRRTGNE